MHNGPIGILRRLLSGWYATQTPLPELIADSDAAIGDIAAVPDGLDPDKRWAQVFGLDRAQQRASTRRRASTSCRTAERLDWVTRRNEPLELVLPNRRAGPS
jgi:hypothetical protein